MPFHRILVATDLTPTSTPALRMALENGRIMGASVTVLYVSPPVHDGALTPLTEEELEHCAVRLRREKAVAFARVNDELCELRRNRPDLPEPDVIFRYGNIADTIICTATEVDADLVMMGTHRNGATPLIPGSRLSDIERYAIERTLEQTGGSTVHAANVLGISPRKIQYRLRDYKENPNGNAGGNGSNGNGKHRSDTLGSVAERVVRRIRRPVMVVPA